MDALRTDKNLILQYAVPGVEKDDLVVEISEDEGGRLLSVGGFLHENYIGKEDQYQIRELSGQEFRRVIRLPSDLSNKEPTVNLKDGILTVSFEFTSQIVNDPKIKKLKIN
jgi:HSP20 family molecular chaperone IbpA